MTRTAHTDLSKNDFRGRALAGHARRLGFALCSVVCSSVVAALAQEDIGGLQLETGSPDALCPDLALTREAVRRRLENRHGPGYLGDAVLGGIDGCVAQPVLTGPSIFYRRTLPRNRR